MSELWSAQQREWLQAMGHTVLALAGTETAAAPALAQESERADDARPAPARADGGRAAPSREAGGDPPLLRNLLRAARRQAGDAAVLALFDAQALRGNPAAKRALWPQLRGLRRGSARG
ncbi:alanine acetyltransferase [Lysobacter sp. TAB13]|uniref:alanine acetyltransferase n=1 Tax=Lysobacter sp. TAB13 TaxID=3233065 RepID=UPI003F9A161F